MNYNRNIIKKPIIIINNYKNLIFKFKIFKENLMIIKINLISMEKYISMKNKNFYKINKNFRKKSMI